MKEGNRGQRSEVGDQKAKKRGNRKEKRGQKTEDGPPHRRRIKGRKTEDRGQTAEEREKGVRKDIDEGVF